MAVVVIPTFISEIICLWREVHKKLMKPMKKIPSLVVSTVRLAIVYFRDFIEEAINLSTSMGVGANNIQVGDVIDLPDKADKVGRITDIKKMDGYSLLICSFEERPTGKGLEI